jgi:hypothetical protein
MSRFHGTKSGSIGSSGTHVTLGTFKRDPIDAKPGTVIPFGERPAGRPFANELGLAFTSKAEDEQFHTRRTDKASPPRRFSWEEKDA